MSFEPITYPATPEEIRRALAPNSAAEVVLIAAQCLRVGSPDHALLVCQAWDGAPDPSITLMMAAALFGRGEHAPAIALVDEVLTQTPANVAGLFYRAQMAQHAGDLDRAQSLLLQVLQGFPDFPGAQAALASVRLPGPPYRDVLRRLHQLLRPHTYLEVGVETGATLGLAREAARAIGIDPDASALRRDLLAPNTRVYEEASDAFFARNTRAQVLDTHSIDFAFIDGMHLFEYALRDFMNIESWASPGGVIALHDCLPVFPLTASRERRTKFWVGDVWKVVQILREYRPDLSVKVVMTAPSGLCLVRNLDPRSRVLKDRLTEVVERYQSLAFPSGSAAAPEWFDCVPASEDGLRQALGMPRPDGGVG